MAASGGYERKLSGEEAREGYVMILKDRLGFFPPPGESFELIEGGETRPVAIEAVDCDCRGPGKPHQHYRLGCHDLRAGDHVRISREGPRGSYHLEVVVDDGIRRKRRD